MHTEAVYQMFLSILQHENSYFGLFVAIILYYMFHINKKIDSLSEGVNKRINTLSEKFSQLISDLAQRVSALEGSLATLLSNSQTFLKKKSPLALTEEGEKALKESGGKAFIDKSKEKLFQDINNERPKIAYDVQEICFKLMLSKYSRTDDFIPMKKYVYSNPIEIGDIIHICATYLRDLYLQEHSEIEE